MCVCGSNAGVRSGPEGVCVVHFIYLFINVSTRHGLPPYFSGRARPVEATGLDGSLVWEVSRSLCPSTRSNDGHR